MNGWKIAALLAAGMIIGCMAGSPPVPATPGTPATTSTSSPAGLPLVIDRGDLRLGTTVYFRRVPTASEINDLSQERALAHVVIVLDRWPDDPVAMAPVASVPPEADVVVLLPGYPPTRGAADAWNYVDARIRMVLLVDGPPPNSSMLDDLNNMRYLERVVATMDQPSRNGFDRLQRPLVFRKVIG